MPRSRIPASSLAPSKMTALHEAYLEVCDAKDGVKDGFSSDPEDCAFDPKLPSVRTKDGPDCLTAAQVETMRTIYGAAVTNPRTGERVFAGFPPGSEQQVGIFDGGAGAFSRGDELYARHRLQEPEMGFQDLRLRQGRGSRARCAERRPRCSRRRRSRHSLPAAASCCCRMAGATGPYPPTTRLPSTKRWRRRSTRKRSRIPFACS